MSIRIAFFLDDSPLGETVHPHCPRIGEKVKFDEFANLLRVVDVVVYPDGFGHETKAWPTHPKPYEFAAEVHLRSGFEALGRPVLISLSDEGAPHTGHGPQRQVGWIGHTGNVYRYDEEQVARKCEPGGYMPFYIDLDD